MSDEPHHDTSPATAPNGKERKDANRAGRADRSVGDFPVAGKIVVITGGGSGICLAFAKLAASSDSSARTRIILADLRLTPEAEEFVLAANREVSLRGDDVQVIFVKTNVMRRSELEELVQTSLRAWGEAPDIWVAGAGVFEPEWSSFWEDSEGDGYDTLSINLAHPIKLTRIAMQTLVIHDKKGVVLVVGSTTALAGNYPRPLYCATKHAINGFVRSMEPADQPEGIKVVCLSPGIVATAIWHDSAANREQFSYTDDIAITPTETASAMLELIEKGVYAGGTILKVDRNGRQVMQFEKRRRPGADDAEKARRITEKSWQPIRLQLDGLRGTALSGAAVMKVAEESN